MSACQRQVKRPIKELNTFFLQQLMSEPSNFLPIFGIAPMIKCWRVKTKLTRWRASRVSSGGEVVEGQATYCTVSCEFEAGRTWQCTVNCHLRTTDEHKSFSRGRLVTYFMEWKQKNTHSTAIALLSLFSFKSSPAESRSRLVHPEHQLSGWNSSFGVVPIPCPCPPSLLTSLHSKHYDFAGRARKHGCEPLV